MKKKRHELMIDLIGCGDAGVQILNVADSTNGKNPQAVYALEAFKREDQMDFVDNEGTRFIVPFHAVSHIIDIASEITVADKPSAYGC